MPWQPIDGDDEFPTLGYDVADWMMEFLLMPDRDGDNENTSRSMPTQEQIEFPRGLYRTGPDTGRRVKTARGALASRVGGVKPVSRSDLLR